MYFRIN
jgi:hypothetical protein